MTLRGPAIFTAAALAALALAAGATGARAGDPTGREIMERVDKDHRAKDERAAVDMILQVEGRQPRRRKVIIMSQVAKGDDDNSVIRNDRAGWYGRDEREDGDERLARVPETVWERVQYATHLPVR